MKYELTDAKKRQLAVHFYAGDDDEHIAKPARVPVAAVKAWRHACGLAPNTPLDQQPGRRKKLHDHPVCDFTASTKIE